MTNRNIIAIDGPAASGKGTLARRIAEKLSYAHMDTGLLYRAIAYGVLQTGAAPTDQTAALTSAQNLAALNGNHGISVDALKEERITEAASHVAAIPEVRKILLVIQRAFAENPSILPNGNKCLGAVLDGRDIGTVICPAAPVKLYITASLETRAQRRFKELQNKDITVTYEAVFRDMQERDARDAARASSPMKPADDAVLLNTTDLGPDEALEKALSVIRDKILSA